MSSKRKVLLKIIILGDSGVGKTAFLQKYVHGHFIMEHKATIGADFITKELVIDDKMVTLQIWDTAGQERFQSLGVAFYRGADACVLVYDITNQKSFEDLEQWKREFIGQAQPEDESSFPFLVIGNKADLNENRQVSVQAGREFCNKHGLKFFETSAKTGQNVEDAMKDIAAAASAQPTAPFFNDIVAGSITLDDDEETTDEAPQQSGCQC
jgi:Ras-related protein Rab-7A